MKNGLFKKSMSVFLAVLMLLTCWVFVAPAQADAVSASTIKSTNETALNSIGSFDTNVTTIHGSFGSDSDYLDTQYYDAIYHNVLYTSGTVTTSGSGEGSSRTGWAAQSGKTEYGSSWTGSNGIYLYWYHPSATLMYDGDTSNLPRLGVALNTVMYYSSTWSRKTVNRLSWVSSGGNGFDFNENWHGSDGRLNFNYMWHGQGAMMGYTSTVTNDSLKQTLSGNNNDHFYANLLKFTGSMSDTEFYRSANPVFSFLGGNEDSQKKTITAKAATTNTLYIINYKPLKAALNEALGTGTYGISTLKANAAKYTTASMAEYVAAVKALIAAKPNNYVNSSKNDYTGYANAASAAITKFNNAKANLKIQQYTVRYDNMFDYNAFNISGSLTVDKRTDTGFTVTSTAADGNTGFSEAIPVEPGKTYVFSADVTYDNTVGGAGYDMYVHTLNVNKEGEITATPDTSNGAHREGNVYISLTGQTTNKTPYIRFTAGTNTKYIRIRFDANNAGNVLTVNKIRVCEDLGTSYNAPKSYDYGATMGTLPTPTRTGYTFNGWVDANGNAVSSSTTVTDDTALYSKWTVNQYTITFNTDGGTAIADIKQDYGTAVTAPANPTKDGYKFTGWDKEIPATMPAEDLTINAIWEVDTATVTFANEDGTTIKSTTLNVGAAVTAPANPSKDATEENHYTFIGWKSSVDNNVYAADGIPTVSGAVTYTAQFEATAHSYTSEVTKEATHLAEGVRTYTCACGDTYTEAIARLEGHTYTESVTKNPTCTEKGIKTFTCACGASYTEDIDALNHNYNAVVTAPTCTAGGYTTHTCTRCNDSYTDSEVAATGHAWNDGEVTKNPTCNDEGVKTFTCGTCGATKTEAVSATGHTAKEAVTENNVDAECLTDGSYDTVVYCSVCDAELSRTPVTVPATGHSFGAITEANNATCTAAGNKAYKQCENCSKYFAADAGDKSDAGVASVDEFVISALNHDFAKDFTVDKKASCTEAGSKSKHCSRCEATTDVTEIPVREHHLVDNGVEKEATCEATGTMNKKCDNAATDEYEACTYTTTVEIPAKGHSYGDLIAKVPATCISEGTIAHYKCSACSKTFDENKAEVTKLVIEIDASAHTKLNKTDAVEATCYREGNIAYWTCEGCNNDYSDEAGTVAVTIVKIPKEAHTPAEAVKENIDKADCSNAGSYEEVVYCSVAECKAELSRNEKTIDACEHDFSDWEEIVAPTYTSKGTEKRECQNAETDLYEACTYSETQDIPMLEDTTAPTGTISIDKSTWNKFLETITFGIYTSDAVELEITAEDAESGVNKIYYYIAADVMTKAEVAAITDWTEYSGKVELDKADAAKMVVYAKLVNTQGGAAYLSTDGVTFDKTAPVITSEIDCTSATITVTEANLATVTVNNKAVTLTDGKYTVEGAGSYTVVATDLADNTTTVDVEIKGHTAAEAVKENEEAATCYAEGSYDSVVYCSVEECKHEISRTKQTIEKIAHTPAEAVVENEVAATCGTDGSYDSVVYCSVEACKAELSRTPVTVPATGEHVYATEEDRKEATCTEDGYVVMACGCGAKETTTLKAPGHKPAEAVKENEVPATCGADGSYDTVVYCSVCDAELSRTPATVPATGHAWTVEYNFAEDGSACTATRVCANDVKHNVTANATITSAVKTPATCEGKGTTTYTATFEEEWAEEKKLDVVDIDAINHAWSVTYNFAEDGSACTATRVCANDAKHNVTANATITSAVKTPATCEGKGTTTYTATFAEDWAEAQHIDVVDIPAINHDYDTTDKSDLTRPTLVDGEWTKGYYTYTCKNDPSHKTTEKVDRATYTAYEAALANLKALLDTDITEAAKTAIRNAIEANEVADDRIATEQGVVNAAAEALVAVFDQYKGSLNTYTVTFKIEGSADVVVEVISGNNATAPENPAKAYDEDNHYKFIGWDKDFTNVTGDLTVTAKFEAIKHIYTHTDKDDTYHTDKCTCGYKKDVKHTETSEVTTKASCDADGVRTYTCSVCGGTRTEKITKRNHNIVDTTVALEPTCSATGIMNQKCDNAETDEYKACTYTTTRVIEKDEKAHKAEADFTVMQKATCEANGYKAILCEYCDAELSTETINKRDHVYTDNGVATQATCENEGVMNTICTNAETATHKACSHESTRVIDKLKHSYTGVYKFAVATKTHSQMCVNGCNGYGNETACTFDAVVTAPDCYNKGYTTYTCSVCTGYYKADETTREHIYVYAEGDGTKHSVSCQYEDCSYTATENCSGGTATCKDKAVCEKCDTAWGEKDAENHTGAADVIKNYKQATCSEEGYTGDVHWSCCDALETKGTVAVKLAHTEVEIPAVAPTCTATGLTAGVKCSVCKEVLTEQETVDSLGHKYEGKVTKEASCTEAGVMTYTCKNDASHTYTEEIKANGHTLAQVEAKAPTCTEAGYEAYEHCSACDYTTFKAVDATGHKYEGKVTKEATCTEKGVMTYTCKNDASHTYTEEIAAKGHALAQVEAKAPTCTEAGYEAYEYCSACDYTTFKEVVATGHTEVEIPAVEATCKKTGLTAGVKCSVCNEVLVAQEVVEKAAHKEVTVGNVPASCINNGSTGKVECEVCGTTIKEDEVIPKLPHEFKADPEYVIGATCTSGKISVYKCKFCTETKSVEETDANGNPINLKPHVIIELEKKEPTCEEAGYYTTICTTCDTMVKTVVIPALGHADKDEDGVCDNCNGAYVESENGSKVCGCICHKESWIMRILYKIIRFFWKLFGIGKSCACGTVHY